MQWLGRFFRGLLRGLLGLVLFCVLAVAWTAVLFFVDPWHKAPAGDWPRLSPLVVSSAQSGRSWVVLPWQLAKLQQEDPGLQPWPRQPAGEMQEGGVRAAWKSVAGAPWQYEVSWDDGDNILESRYRVEGERAVLIEYRGRTPALAFQGMGLALLSLLLWKLGRWLWRRKKVAAAA